MTTCEIHQGTVLAHTAGGKLCPVRGCFRGTLEREVVTIEGLPMIRTMSREGVYAWKLHRPKRRCRPCEERKRLLSTPS